MMTAPLMNVWRTWTATLPLIQMEAKPMPTLAP